MKHTFVTKLIQEEGKDATGFNIPSKIVEALNGGKRPAVKVVINDNYAYQSTLAAYGDVYMLPLSKQRRKEAKVEAGDEVTLSLELDTEERTVEVPEYLQDELRKHELEVVFNALAYSKRKEFVRQVESAKAEATRQKRLAQIIHSLQAR